MKRKGRLVIHQTVGEKNCSTKDESAYWHHAHRHGRYSKEDQLLENPLANPDVLADSINNSIWGKSEPPELAELIIEKFMDSNGNFPILSKRENDVLKVYTATGDLRIVRKETNLSSQAVNTYMARIRNKFKRLLPLL